MKPESRSFLIDHMLGIYQALAFLWFEVPPPVSWRRIVKAWAKGGSKEVERVCYRAAYFERKFHPRPRQTHTIGFRAFMEGRT